MISRLVVVVLLASVAFIACDDADLSRDGRPNSLMGSAWRVVTIDGRVPVPGGEPTAIFAAAEVKGSAGCNSYGGRYSYDPNSGALAFEFMSMTAMACAEPARNEVETLFMQTMGRVSSASIDPQGRLVLTGPGGEIVLAVNAVTQ